MPRCPRAVDLLDFFFDDLLLVVFPDFEAFDDFEDLWELEEDLVEWEVAVAVATPEISSETPAIRSSRRIRRLKRKQAPQGKSMNSYRTVRL